MKQKLKKIVQFITNPRLLICFVLAWMITNGWSYALFVIGTYFKISWMITIASAYLALLWLPFTPEKLITIAISIALLRFLFPDDIKTLAVLKEFHQKTKDKIRKKKEAYKETKQENRQKKQEDVKKQTKTND